MPEMGIYLKISGGEAVYKWNYDSTWNKRHEKQTCEFKNINGSKQ